MSNLTEHGVVAVIQKESKILLLEDCREPMKGFWGPPHGRCEESDKSEENSVIRETLEETGLHVKPQKKLWTTAADTKTNTVSFWSAQLTNPNEEIVLDLSESSKSGWFSIIEALELKLYPGTKKFLNLVKEGILSLD